MTFPYFTIGHSTRSIKNFIDLLAASEIEIVVDVRTIPRSRTNPQYNSDALPGSLSDFQIAYEHIAELGGRRARARDIAPDVNEFWENQSFHNYADYAMGDGFRSGLGRLRELGSVTRCAVMCAEAVWWRCHRIGHRHTQAALPSRRRPEKVWHRECEVEVTSRAYRKVEGDDGLMRTGWTGDRENPLWVKHS